MLAPIIAQEMTATWGQQVLADNRPGANTMNRAQVVATAAPNG